MKISIDPKAGFCSGVKRAISLAEEELQRSGHLLCLGQVVHNEQEENRLKNLGLEIIDQDDFRKLQNAVVLIRAHGEPPETYETAARNNIRLIDGTCPVVIKLQKKIRKSFIENHGAGGQIVIFGKKNHPEVLGLSGQTDNLAIIVEEENDLAKIDFSQPVSLFAQTTKSKEAFNEISSKIRLNMEQEAISETTEFCSTDSTCRQVTGRDENLRNFANENDIVIFVGGKKSSNGHYLFEIVKSENSNAFYVDSPEKIVKSWFDGAEHIGVTGATSTPGWLLNEVATNIEKLILTA
jgi:4-hydroxy-3-methylbut-2-enyl diphosphate reductase